MNQDALVYSENEFGQIDGKVANGLARHSEKYNILGIIDSTKSGLDAGEYLDGVKNGIPVFESMDDALRKLASAPGFFIYGITGIGGSFVRMQLDVPLPLATLVANAVMALAGLVLVLAGARGAEAVDGIFNLLGVLLIAAGLALAGYSYMLRQQDEGR